MTLTRYGPVWQRLLAVLLCVPAMVLSLLFWRAPAGDSSTMSALLIDRTLQFATLIVLPVGILTLLTAPWPVASVAAVALSVVSVMLGLTLTLSGLDPPVRGGIMALAVMTLGIGLATLLWLLHKKITGVRAGAILLAPLALLPSVQFWHASSYVPGRLRPDLDVVTEVAQRERVGEIIRATVTATLKNEGDASAELIDSSLSVCLRRERSSGFSPDLVREDRACETHEFFNESTVIGGDDTIRQQIALAAPAATPLVEVVASVSYAREDRLRVGEAVPIADSDNSCPIEARRFELLADSHYRGVILEPRWMTLASEPSGDETAYFTAGTDPACQMSEHDVARYVGFSEWSTYSEDWLRQTGP